MAQKRPSPKSTASARTKLGGGGTWDDLRALQTGDDESMQPPNLAMMPLGPGTFGSQAIGEDAIKAANAGGEWGTKLKGFLEQNYPTELKVRVHIGDQIFDDAVKGLNKAHAMFNAAKNWPSATKIERLP